MMHQKIFLQPEVAEAIVDLVEELASELDLHYDDDELSAIMKTMVKLEHMVDILKSAGVDAPDTYKHLLNRYRRDIHMQMPH